jgi:hypothetical protein
LKKSKSLKKIRKAQPSQEHNNQPLSFLLQLKEPNPETGDFEEPTTNKSNRSKICLFLKMIMKTLRMKTGMKNSFSKQILKTSDQPEQTPEELK